jgi:hypothetical protein
MKLIVLLHLEDAVDGTDLEAALAAGAVVGVDDRQFLGQLFAGSGFGHDGVIGGARDGSSVRSS